MTTQEETLKVEDLSDHYDDVHQSTTQEETLKIEDYDEAAQSIPPESPLKVKEEVDDHVEFSEKTSKQPPKYCLRARKRKVYSETGHDLDPDENESQTRRNSKVLPHSRKHPQNQKPKTKKRNKEGTFTCDECDQTFNHKGWYNRHIANAHMYNKQPKSSIEDKNKTAEVYQLDMESLGDVDINIKPEVTFPESTRETNRVAGNDKAHKILVKEPFKIHLHPLKNKDYGTQKESNPDSPPLLIHDGDEKKLPAKNPSNFCSICSQYFSSENELDEHDCNVFSCDQCVRIFRNQESLDRHFELHATDPRKILYDCEHCHRVFKRKSDLINHSRLLHKIEVLFF